MTYPVSNMVTANYPDGIQDFTPSVNQPNELSVAQITATQALVSQAAAPGLRLGFPFVAFPSSASDLGVTSFPGGGGITYGTRDGIRVAKITSTSGYCVVQSPVLATPRVVTSGRLHVLFYVPDASTLNTLVCYLGDGVPLTNSYTCAIDLGIISQIDNGSRGSWSGWYVATIDPAAEAGYSGMAGDAVQSRWTVNTGAPTHAGTAMSVVQFLANPYSGKSLSVEIAGVWADEANTMPAVVFTSDDCEVSWYTGALPILEKYQMRGTHSAIAARVNTAGYMTTAQCQDALSRGHEFITHGMGTYPAGIFDLTDYTTVAQMVADIQSNQAFIVSNGLSRNNSHNLYAYPSGHYQISRTDTKIQQALDICNITHARCASFNGSGLLVNKYTKKQRRYLPVMAHAWTSAPTEASNISQIILRIQQAAALGKSSILMNHRYVTTPVSGIDISLVNFETVVAAVANLCVAGTVRNLLFSELCATIDAA